ncbi:DUF7352 domain-containing protein [Marinobacterium litorale]|uniref:DUF7352 domain-containing protein n=1 Tax=Marinobacterium litorale TaxID=404770 RepID=UPI0004091622|nr:hypothetical protein [Marinobacterium litorale]
MKAILKYRLEISDKPISLSLAQGFRPVRFEYVVSEKALFLWTEESLRADISRQNVQFRITRTGEPIQEGAQHLMTALDAFGPEAYHLFLLEGEPCTMEPRPVKNLDIRAA